jgi:hypothetical protein
MKIDAENDGIYKSKREREQPDLSRLLGVVVLFLILGHVCRISRSLQLPTRWFSFVWKELEAVSLAELARDTKNITGEGATVQ